MRSLSRQICLALVEVLVLDIFCFLFELGEERRSGVIFFSPYICVDGLLYIFRLKI